MTAFGVRRIACALAVGILCGATAASAQISGVSVTNLSDADSTTDTLTDGRQRLSTTSFSSSPTSISARYAFVTAADSGIFTNSSIAATNSYRVNFNVNVPGAYQLTVNTNWNGGLTTVDDTTFATVAATADVSPLTGTQSGGTLASGTLSLTDPGIRTSGANGQTPFGGTLAAAAVITGVSNGANQPHQLQFAWTSSCNSPGGGAFVGGDECAVRAGLASTLSGTSAGAYPGQGGRNIATDGHFVTVSIVSFCGNGVVDGAVGEECDQGAGVNGMPGSCCAMNCTLKEAGESCRNAAGPCDVPELCDGVTVNCPADAFATVGTVCRASSPGEVCDEVEVCPGNSATCPPDGVQTAGTECRAAAGVCDVAEACDGVSKFCPADGKSTALCRASAGVCDLAELCDGIDDDCPADAKSTALCRAAADVCDAAEQCDGADDDCPADALASAGTECRAVAGDCDVAEQCDGVDPACPADGFVSAGTECRGEAGVCDVAEQCDGGGPDCPADAFAPDTTVCRAASPGEVCDVEEFCTGSDVNCPADAVEPDTTVCRAAAGVCDIAELCDGTNKTCPADSVEPDTTVCRAASAGEVCDVPETCDGSGVDCPADAVEPDTTVCRAAVDVCDVAETCDGIGKLCGADAKSSAECRAAAGVCDVAEVCDGVSDTCPADVSAPDGTSCEDGSFCNGEETCTAGACGGGGSPCPMGQGCDDTNDVCLLGDCPVEPVVCRLAQKSRVLIKDNANDARDKLVWKWIKGASTSQAEFGTPTVDAEYALCFYAGTSAALIAQAAVPPGPNWSAISSKGYKYKDPAGSAAGITRVILKGSTTNKAKALIKGKGVNLPDFALPIAGGDLPLIVQLRNNANGICWESEFATATKNLATQFKAKTP